MALEWLKDVPEWTSPPILAAVPPRPALNVTSRPQGSGIVPTQAEANLPPSSETDDDQLAWQTEVECEAHTDLAAWLDVMMELIKYPERTSTNILRADILFVENVPEQEHTAQNTSKGWSLRQTIIREILPRRPGVNSNLIELCSIYVAPDDAQTALVTYTPLIVSKNAHFATMDELMAASKRPDKPSEIPFYHPAVLALAFTYESRSSPGAVDNRNRLAIHILPFPSNASEPALNRVAHSLLKTIHIHTWGKAHDYKARVTHDRLVNKELFQDVYLNLKHRWASYLCKEWKEKTNPEKHVHEDLAVCAWLMVFWRNKFGNDAATSTEDKVRLRDRPWLADTRTWGRPTGGFVDVGCGNGLLVWLLNNEGYIGSGFDIRPRKSWELFDHETTIQVEFPSPNVNGRHTPHSETVSVRKANLHVHTLDAVRIIYDHLQASGAGSAAAASRCFPAGSFLIGNHADEMTPLMPLLASTIPDCTGLLNIPCCPWMVSGDRFTRTNYRVAREEVANLLDIPRDASATEDQIAHLRKEMSEIALGPPVDSVQKEQPSAGGSKMIAYLTYISHLHLIAGWHVEKEALRMPSTKNWSVVSTQKVRRDAPCEKVLELMSEAVQIWKARDARSEGKWFLSPTTSISHDKNATR